MDVAIAMPPFPQRSGQRIESLVTQSILLHNMPTLRSGQFKPISRAADAADKMALKHFYSKRPVIRRLAPHGNLMAFFTGEGYGESRSGPGTAVAVGADGVAQSGQTISAFCKQRNLSKPTFGYWQRKLGFSRRTKPRSLAAKFVPRKHRKGEERGDASHRQRGDPLYLDVGERGAGGVLD